jgi:hypothetical protein
MHVGLPDVRACSVCGARTATGNKCPRHAEEQRLRHQQAYGYAYRKARKQTLDEEELCCICGEPARPGDPLTGHHLDKVRHGGDGSRANLSAAHLSCNSRER